MATEEIDEGQERRVLTEWAALTNEVRRLCVDLNAATKDRVGLTTDPAIYSLILFKRALGHIHAFSLLFNDKLYLDADGCARNAVEVAICLANLAARRTAFIDDLRSDAAATTKGQIPIWHDADPALARDATDSMQKIFGDRRDDGTKHPKLSLSDLADGASLSRLYTWYKHYSGTRVHVTGLSVLADIVALDDDEHEQTLDTYRRLNRVMALATIGGASVISCEAHANIHGADELRDRAAGLMRQMSELGPVEIFG